jgi:hypothetical protein
MRSVANIAVYVGSAIYIAGALYSLSTDGAPRCPDPSPRSVEALFAPCLAGIGTPVADPVPSPVLPNPTAPIPPVSDDNGPAIARTGEDVETTGSVP